MTLLLDALLLDAVPVLAQRPAPIDQQLRDNQQRLEQIRRERTSVEHELERLRSQAHGLSEELANIERQRETTNRLVNEIDRQLNALSGQIDQLTTDLGLAQDALLEKRAVLERRVADIYKRGPLYDVQVLVAAESFGDLLSRYKYLYLVSRQDRQLVQDVERLASRVAVRRRQLVEVRDQLAARRSDRATELDRYVALERAREQTLRETRASQREAQRRLTALARDEARVNDLVAALERARREAAARGRGPTGPGTIGPRDLGRLDWPLEGSLLYRYGPQTLPNGTTVRWTGVGIQAPLGTPVRAVRAGTVVRVETLGTYGLSLFLDHGGGYYSLYMQLQRVVAGVGDVVIQGQVIGAVGGESSDQGPHLHFEIRGEGGIALDPLNWLKIRR